MRIPCGLAPGRSFDHTISLLGFEPGEQPFKRLEYLRMFAPGDGVYDAVYGRREDVESDHNLRKSLFPANRMPAFGAESQLLVMLMQSHGHNARVDYLIRHPEVLTHGYRAVHDDPLADAA